MSAIVCTDDLDAAALAKMGGPRWPLMGGFDPDLSVSAGILKGAAVRASPTVSSTLATPRA